MQGEGLVRGIVKLQRYQVIFTYNSTRFFSEAGTNTCILLLKIIVLACHKSPFTSKYRIGESRQTENRSLAETLNAFLQIVV